MVEESTRCRLLPYIRLAFRMRPCRQVAIIAFVSFPSIFVNAFKPLVSRDIEFTTSPTTTTSTTEDDDDEDTIHRILSHIRTLHSQHHDNDRPCVTLAYAQSLDGHMATRHHPSRYPISGPTSMRCTHALRSVHEGILVGANTWRCDLPRLTNRLWKEQQQQHEHPQQPPIRIVLDTNLSLLPLLLRRQHYDATGTVVVDDTTASRPILVCCAADATLPDEFDDDDDGQFLRFVRCQRQVDGRLDLADVLYQLRHECGIRTLMVEGGPTVLQSFFSAQKKGSADSSLVDCVSITINPCMVMGGSNGVGPYDDKSDESTMLLQACTVLGVFFWQSDSNLMLLYKRKNTSILAEDGGIKGDA